MMKGLNTSYKGRNVHQAKFLGVLRVESSFSSGGIVSFNFP